MNLSDSRYSLKIGVRSDSLYLYNWKKVILLRHGYRIEQQIKAYVAIEKYGTTGITNLLPDRIKDP